MSSAGRSVQQMRSVTITRHFTKHAKCSVLIEFDETQVPRTAPVEEGVPRFFKGQGQGWITAEYGMFPHAAHIRNPREAAKGKQGGRKLEIQRLMAWSLLVVVDLNKLDEYALTLNCDVLQTVAASVPRPLPVRSSVTDALTSMRKKKGQLNQTDERFHGGDFSRHCGRRGGV